MTVNLVLALLFGVLTATVNAISVITQHIASSRLPSTGRGWRFMLDLARQPLWLLGGLALFGSLVFQALALHFGPIGLVQPLLISELVLALLIRWLWLHQPVRMITIISSVITTALLTLFIIFASPSSGQEKSSASLWVITLAVSSLVIAGLIFGARSGSVRRRAGLFGIATAIAWALEAVFIKVLTDSITTFGYVGTVSHWPLYAFILCGGVGLYCEQAALHVGPLSVSQPFIVIVDPLVSVLLGVVLFAERWRGGPSHLIAGVVILMAISVSAWVLIVTGPESMTAHTPEVH